MGLGVRNVCIPQDPLGLKTPGPGTTWYIVAWSSLQKTQSYIPQDAHSSFSEGVLNKQTKTNKKEITVLIYILCLHWKGSLVCLDLMWIVNLFLTPVLNSQWSHLNGSKPKCWILICLFKVSLEENIFSHLSHWCSLISMCTLSYNLANI